MAETRWWKAVQPHKDICEGRVNESLFAADLGRAIRGEGPDEYCRPTTFFQKTYITQGLRELLETVLRRLAGDTEQNAVVILQTSFGGGKTHSELAIYHLLVHPNEAMAISQVADLVGNLGLSQPPACRVAVLAGTGLNPKGRKTREGLQICSLWGEMAYQLGGPDAFALVADTDAVLVSPGSEVLEELLERVGPSVILLDETLHYVDKAAAIPAGESTLAAQTVAFLRELTDAVNAASGCMMVVSLTASRMEQLSPQANEWLVTLNEHVLREAAKKTPIERTEIHEVVRQRLFDHIDEEMARVVAARYRKLYASIAGLPSQKTGEAYQRLMQRSYPFHPELVSVLYERWGSKPGFQLTRDTLRFLAFAMQKLWRRRMEVESDLVQCLDIDLSESNLRGMVREVSGDPAWETVIGADIAAQSGAEPAKAQFIDEARTESRALAQGLATTILLYSLSGGENPYAARDELRLACAREDVPEALWDDILERFKKELFYYYFDDARLRFRKEPNVVSLQRTYHANLSDAEIDAYAQRTVSVRGLGADLPGHGFQAYFRPADSQAVPDDDTLKLVVLDPKHSVYEGAPHEETRTTCLDILERRGSVLRQYRNTVIFAAADAHAMAEAIHVVAEYLSWRKIQLNETDWDRIGGAQQAVVKENLENLEGAVRKALISAYGWALVPTEGGSGTLALKAIRLGTYGPGKLIVPMVWERLTAEGGSDQAILKSLTPETLLQRYGSQVWPPTEAWVTTGQLWDRCTRLVALPMLASRQVLLDTLTVGQHEGHFGIGNLVDESSPRDERDSYLSLHFEEAVLPPQTPAIGERWLLLREGMYKAIANQPSEVTPAEVEEAIRELDGEGQPVRVDAVYNYVKKGKMAIDDKSFMESVARVVRDQGIAYRADNDAPDTKVVPQSLDELKTGVMVVQKVKPPKTGGRTVTVSGKLGSLNELAPLYNNVLKPLQSQNPDELTITLSVKAHYKKNPGAGLTATLADGFNAAKFPGLTLSDSEGK